MSDDFRRERAEYLGALNHPPLESSMSDYYRVIRPSSLPMRCPLVATLVFYLTMDRLSAPGWLFGVVGVIMATVWMAWIYGMAVNVAVDAPGFGKRSTKQDD
jgi:hypothetical protein